MQIQKLTHIIKNILERLRKLEQKNNSVLIARINQLEKRVEILEQKQ